MKRLKLIIFYRQIRNKRGLPETPSGSSSDNSGDEDFMASTWLPVSNGSSPGLPLPLSIHTSIINPSSQSLHQPIAGPILPLARLHPQVHLQAFPHISLNGLKERVVFWGGNITITNNDISLVNTCSFDNLLNGLAVLYRMKPNFLNPIDYPNINERQPLVNLLSIVENARRNDRTFWNEAKKKFILDFIPLNDRPNLSIISKRKTKKSNQNNSYQMDFYGTEYDRFIRFMGIFQTFAVTQICETNCVFNNVVLGNLGHQMFLNKINNLTLLDFGWSGRCPSCNLDFDVIPDFGNINPHFLIIETIRPCFTFNELPEILNIGGKNYKLFCATIKDTARDHFVSLLQIGNDTYFIDGKKSVCELMAPFNPAFLRQRNIRTIEKHYKMPINSTIYYLL